MLGCESSMKSKWRANSQSTDSPRENQVKKNKACFDVANRSIRKVGEFIYIDVLELLLLAQS